MIVFKLIIITCLSLVLPELVFAHTGKHGNDECMVLIGDVELRLNGYQFQGRNPDKHYCRHFPRLGETIIKIDSITSDLTGKGIEIQLLKRNSWLELVFNSDNAYTVIKQQPIQYFSKQVVSIDADIQERDVYAIKLRLHAANGKVTEQQFTFLVGAPIAQVMVAISVVLLIVIVIIFLRQWIAKR